MQVVWEGRGEVLIRGGIRSIDDDDAEDRESA